MNTKKKKKRTDNRELGKMKEMGKSRMLCFCFQTVGPKQECEHKGLKNHDMGMGRKAFILYIYTQIEI